MHSASGDSTDDMDVLEIVGAAAVHQTNGAGALGPGTSEASSSFRVSFGVRKKKDFVGSALNLLGSGKKGSDDEDGQAEQPESKRRRITHFEGADLERDEEEKSKSNIVIPLVVEKDWRIKKLLAKRSEGKLTVEEEAKLAVLSSSSGFKEQDLENTENGTAEEGSSVDADFDSVPVEAFGLAVLRGCGWKEGDGIGKSNKRVVLVKMPERRPKGLGLGNDIRLFKQKGILAATGSAESNKDVLELKKGSYIKVTKGTHRENYGQVESFDEDNASVIVKLALGKKNVRVSRYAVAVVSAKDYERDAKCINRKTYESEKRKIEERNVKEGGRKDNGDASRLRDDVEKSVKKSYREVEEDRRTRKNERMWVRPELRVRFIDKKYMGGKLYNEKVHVIDASGRDDCTVQDSRGKSYYQISEDWLETVIPPEGSRIMVVSGKWRGQLAVIEGKEKSKERVLARILHSDDIAKIPYDDVCEWLGPADIEDY